MLNLVKFPPPDANHDQAQRLFIRFFMPDI